jgi:hypothetical protein
VFMRVRRILPALHMYPSDSERNLPTGVGMGGLRHKSRHKIPRREVSRCPGDPPKGTSAELSGGEPTPVA